MSENLEAKCGCSDMPRAQVFHEQTDARHIKGLKAYFDNPNLDMDNEQSAPEPSKFTFRMPDGRVPTGHTGGNASFTDDRRLGPKD